MIIGFQAGTGAGFGAGARIDGQPGVGGEGALSAGFTAALALAAQAPAPVAAGREGGDAAAGEKKAGVVQSGVEPSGVEQPGAEQPGEAVVADGMVAETMDAHADPAMAAAPATTPASLDEAAAAPLPAAVDGRRGVAAPALDAALRQPVTPAVNGQPGQTRTGGEPAAPATGAGSFALPENLRPQLPTPVLRAVEAPALPQSAVETGAPLPTPAAMRAGAAPLPEWSPVKVDAGQAHWGRELMAALGERVEMQLTQQIKQARIRLDPPELGRLQLTVRFDSDRLSVQLQASQPQVREALAQQVDRLRADLVGQYGERVEVTVGQEQRQQRQPGGEAGEAAWQGIAAGLDLQDEHDVMAGDAAVSPRWQGWVNALA